MRDGTVLTADVHRPPSGSGPWPVLLARGPYGSRDPGVLAALDPEGAARRGFLTVVQDVRGRFGSGGIWEPLVNERDDGHESVRWAAGLPGSDGRVAMYGPSYLGHAQWAALTAGPPELVAVMPEFTWADPCDGLVARGGVPELGLVAQWTLGLAGLDRDRDALPATGWRSPALAGLPVPGRSGGPDLPHALPAGSGRPAATLTVAGWYDAFLQGSLDNHVRARELGGPATLIVGPWTHGDRATALPFGAADLRTAELHWLHAVLAGRTPPGPAVRVHLTGTGQWRSYAAWPPPSVPLTLHLRGDGTLSRTPPPHAEAWRTFPYRPADPVPTLGGALLLTDDHPAGPADQRPLEDRADLLVWTGAPLDRPLTVVGRVTALLTAHSSADPADWVVRLTDVAPDGTSRLVTDGITRTAAPGGTVPVDLWSTGHVFRPGHRLRVHVTASSFPRWSPLPTPSDRRVAPASRLMLPVVPEP
ncbi:CocE/NonD family hydrolase [Streptomyces sp. KK5PA1]|uniref:CocE/NonD family hydrolase n=2 Tax=Actinacidiphila acididurans TaxID=2784346 RepID=A0ABS2TLX8_9ACTN|nr:CocE/NonD family hydrolase [Actinacidiphila acididurans]